MPSAASSPSPAPPKPSKPARPRRLGRGLSSLLGDAGSSFHTNRENISHSPPAPAASASSPNDAHRVRPLPLADIAPSPHQPRRDFDEASLSQLAESIRQDGLLQPIVVRPAPPAAKADAPYLLVAGERRLRAARIARLDPIPALVVDMPDRQAAEWALIENMQREDLNPMERAWGVRQLRDDFGVRQQDIADRLGQSRSTIANLLRLTELEREIQAMLARSDLSLGHGKALLAAPPGPQRCELARQAADAAWSVRRLERQAAALTRAASAPGSRKSANRPPAEPSLRAAAKADLERRLSDALAAQTTIHTDASGAKGCIRIDFTDLEHFDALLKRLGVAHTT